MVRADCLSTPMKGQRVNQATGGRIRAGRHGALLKRFSCGSVMPGCGRVFTGADDQRVLDQVLEHAAAAHDMGTASLGFIELVLTHTRPFTPGRPRQRISVGRPGPADDQPGAPSPADAPTPPGSTARPVPG